MGLEIGLSVVEVEGHSLSVINKSQSNGLDRSEVGAYIKDIQQLKRGFQRCWFKHTPRMENRVAHALATKERRTELSLEKWLKLDEETKENGELGKGRKVKTPLG
ncbi:hypothetical protein Goshw_018321, partial [Gossypium schwendimanii]|nr:hypothetical protein [Gossypium schwendimanii]